MIFDKIDKKDKGIVFVYTACSSQEEAKSIGRLAIEEKLAVSADYWLMNSVYPWQGVIHDASQYLLMFATQKLVSNRLIKFIESQHSYNIPMIIRTNTSATSLSYSLWVNNTLEEKEKYITEAEDKIKKDIESSDYQFGRLK